MIPYISFILCILLIIFISKTIKKPLYPHLGIQIITIFMIIFAACRYAVGVDYLVYYDFVNRTMLGAILRFEPLNQLIFFLSVYFKSPFFCFMVYACIIYTFIYKACINNSRRPYLSIFLYICLFYLESLGYIRQAAAISIGLYAFKFIKTRNLTKYCIWIGVAMLFHLSAAILIMAYYIYWKIKLKYAIIIAISSLFLKNIFFLILDKLNFYSGYSDISISGGGKLKFLYPLILTLIFLLHPKMNREDERIFTICLLAIPFPFIFPAHTGMRIGNYFFVYICFLIPYIFQYSNYKIRLLFTILTTMIFFTYLALSVKYVPYTFYWNK